MEKDKFIGMYLEKAMKGHGLPYGLNYLNLLAVQEEKAEKAWNRFCKKQNAKKIKL
jgi:hypothetical protein